MNFIDAAIAILKDSRKALSAEDLTELAQERKLLSAPGKSPLRSMKARLAAELKKGDESRVAQVGEDRWKLAKGAAAAEPRKAKKATTKKAATKKTATAKAATKKTTTAKAGAKKTATAKAATEKAATKKAATKKAATKKTATAKAGAKKTTTARAAKKTATEAAAAKTEQKPARAAKKDTKAKRPATKAKAQPARVAEPEREPEREPEAPEGAAAAEGALVETGEAPRGERTGRRRRRRRRGRSAANDMAPAVADATEAAALEVELPEPTEEEAVVLGEVLAPRQQIRRVAPPATPAEEDIEELYGDELSGTAPGAAFAEFRDDQTEDEDRPLVPEIVATRGDRRKRERMRRGERRNRRDRDRDRGREGRREAPAVTEDVEAPAAAAEAPRPEAAPPRPVSPQAAPPQAAEPRREHAPAQPYVSRDTRGDVVRELYRAGTPLGDAAVEVLGSLREQPVHVKQLAQMLRKRELVDSDPAELWPHLKAALLADEQRHRNRGLRPRVIYHGRDMFSAGPEAATSELIQAEAALARAMDGLSAAVHRALKQQLSRMDASGLERVAQLYLLASGWKNIQWIKQVQRSSYAVGEPPGGMGTVLVGVRAGSEPVDRRGVGELRAGVIAKNLVSGLLLAPQDLSDAARKELARVGRSLSVLVGDAFVAELVRCGVGVLRKSVPAVYFDEGFFSEIEPA